MRKGHELTSHHRGITTNNKCRRNVLNLNNEINIKTMKCCFSPIRLEKNYTQYCLGCKKHWRHFSENETTFWGFLNAYSTWPGNFPPLGIHPVQNCVKAHTKMFTTILFAIVQNWTQIPINMKLNKLQYNHTRGTKQPFLNTRKL